MVIVRIISIQNKAGFTFWAFDCNQISFIPFFSTFFCHWNIINDPFVHAAPPPNQKRKVLDRLSALKSLLLEPFNHSLYSFSDHRQGQQEHRQPHQ
jgi:hypothetical protein